MSPTRDWLLPLYRQMQLIRRFEEESARAYVQGKIGGFLHLYIGQEAVAVGANAALRQGDYVVTTYRDHGLALARGMTARACMAELFGKDTGCSRGMGGSMHMFDAARGFLGGHGIVGGHVALAAGAGFRSKYLGDDRVAICFFGEGATNIGGFHEGLSLAGLWKLPCVFVCENNGYSMGTPVERTLPARDITLKAKGYGMESERFEGHDVVAVYEGLKKAIDRARAGSGPTLVEVLTYRFRGHSMSDPGKYRTPEEVEERKQRDPLIVARVHLAAAGVVEAELAAIDAEVESEIADCLRFAEESPAALESSMTDFVYAPRSEG